MNGRDGRRIQSLVSHNANEISFTYFSNKYHFPKRIISRNAYGSNIFSPPQRRAHSMNYYYSKPPIILRKARKHPRRSCRSSKAFLQVRLEMAARVGSFRLCVYLRCTSLADASPTMIRLASSLHYTRPRVMHSRTYTAYYPRLKEITNRPRLRLRPNGNHSRERIEEVERERISRRDVECVPECVCVVYLRYIERTRG